MKSTYNDEYLVSRLYSSLITSRNCMKEFVEKFDFNDLNRISMKIGEIEYTESSSVLS